MKAGDNMERSLLLFSKTMAKACSSAITVESAGSCARREVPRCQSVLPLLSV